MTYIKKNKPSKPGRSRKQNSKAKFPTLDDLVLDHSLPRIRVKVYPSRKKSVSKPNDQIMIELQCEV